MKVSRVAWIVFLTNYRDDQIFSKMIERSDIKTYEIIIFFLDQFSSKFLKDLFKLVSQFSIIY